MVDTLNDGHTDSKQVLEETLFIKFPGWEDEAVSGMWLMGSPAYVIAIGALYLWFVTSSGPRFMSHRPAFSLKTPMMLYNLCQISVNIWFLFSFLGNEGIVPHLLTESCNPAVPSRNKELRLFARTQCFNSAVSTDTYYVWSSLWLLGLKYHWLHPVCDTMRYTWVWWLVRVLDLFDTVIFVLRKKQSHVTFLHVYHHFIMVFFGWWYFKYVRGESLVFAGLINAFVHVCMYSYYLLAALGPRVQPYLWWKRYLTRLQLVQFFIVFSMHVYLVIFCKLPSLQRFFIFFTIGQNIMFITLFLNFYRKAYSTKKQHASEKAQ